MLWLPAGSICLEETVSGHLNFGLKIPMIMRTKDYTEHYLKGMELAQAADKPAVTKMKEVCTWLQNEIAAAVPDS